MSWHKVWLIKCNGEECQSGHITENPNVDPEGWISDGTQHLCKECQEKQATPLPVPSDDEDLAS
jgi:hypothetical protein